MELFFYSLTAALFSAAAAILQKTALRKTDAFLFSFLLSISTAIIVIPYSVYFGFPQLGKIEILILAIKTLLGALAFLCVMISIKNFELSSVLPLLAFTPALVGIFAFLILGEKISPIKTLGILLMLFGLYVIEIKEQKFLSPVKKLLLESKSRFIIYAMLLFTASSILDKTLIGFYYVKPIDFIIVQQILALPVFALLYFHFGIKRNMTTSLPSANVLLLIFGISLITILYRFLYVSSLQYGEVAIALTLKRFSVFIAVVSSGKFLNEKNIPRKALATILIIGGAYFMIK